MQNILAYVYNASVVLFHCLSDSAISYMSNNYEGTAFDPHEHATCGSVISGFCRDVDEISNLLGYYAA
jgi:hypothetical protein